MPLIRHVMQKHELRRFLNRREEQHSEVMKETGRLDVSMSTGRRNVHGSDSESNTESFIGSRRGESTPELPELKRGLHVEIIGYRPPHERYNGAKGMVCKTTDQGHIHVRCIDGTWTGKKSFKRKHVKEIRRLTSADQLLLKQLPGARRTGSEGGGSTTTLTTTLRNATRSFVDSL
eukprot:CAMPEP_0205910064 /NCGR_PEP_ID=MMETSP1325-20131115/4231_1 /ASSEMBLY_ACC=CAM_ASM_000708 /TAXON_ID=236786 /ORGANISM="Florenciella sp., Strain RCC1007" /LENGTH=175 /DNA_ID=CAMNT_0053276393 /DNA_START=656 /DNA_END=1183 /DNA_ORIENTATION=+